MQIEMHSAGSWQSALDRGLASWNGIFPHLPLTRDLLHATFFSDSDRCRFWESSEALVLSKLDKTSLRIHSALPLSHNPQKFADAIDGFLEESETLEVIFGGGDNHLFPGVPLEAFFVPMSASFQKKGPEVMDFEGHLAELLKPQSAGGELRLPLSFQEQEDLKAFVLKEFPGRWAREIEVDYQKRFMEHYYGYYRNDQLFGYVRLYGWRPDYWAPGVYFSGPSRGMGGLGPIGVASSARGLGFGQEILQLSWQILLKQRCKTVRIDWTTEGQFYERAGLRLVQKYQPAYFLRSI